MGKVTRIAWADSTITVTQASCAPVPVMNTQELAFTCFIEGPKRRTHAMDNNELIRRDVIANSINIPSSVPTAEVADASPSQSGLRVAAEPLFEDWQAWVADFCAHYPLAVEGDTLGTTFLSFGAVILSAILAGTRDETELADATRLPAGFVRFVLAMVTELKVSASLDLSDLQRTLLSRRSDLREVKSSLEAAEEQAWNACATPETVPKLIELRAGRQFGGGMDAWVDEEGYDGWWVN